MRRQVATVAEFLDLTDLSLQTRRTVEEKYGLPFFLSAIMYGKVIHVNFFVFLFLSYRAGPRSLEIQNFCYHGNVTYKRRFLSIPIQ